jgi:hypothetical protein
MLFNTTKKTAGSQPSTSQVLFGNKDAHCASIVTTMQSEAEALADNTMCLQEISDSVHRLSCSSFCATK